MSETGPNEVTRLLELWSAGDSSALEAATEILYADLRRIALSFFRGERQSHTLQPTALIHESYLRLIGTEGMHFDNRKQFLALITKIMRQVLCDHARRLSAAKRGSNASKAELRDASQAADRVQAADSYLILDEALTRLAEWNERQARVIELRYFAGLGVSETAEMLQTSPATVSRDQRMAEAWLNQELASAGAMRL